MRAFPITCLATSILFVATSRLAVAQDADGQVARHRAVYRSVEKNVNLLRRVEATFDTLGVPDQSTDGGLVAAYCDRSAIRLIVVDYIGETGDAQDRLYFDHDSLLFVFQLVERDSPAKHARPRSVRSEERFYFSGDTLIRWLGSKNAPQPLNTTAARERSRQWLEAAHLYQRLMRGCHPKYASQ